MLTGYSCDERGFRAVEMPLGGDLPPEVYWIDMLAPTADEKRFVAREFGIELPTREDMTEIEASSRLYEEDDALFMTSTLVVRVDTVPEACVVTFILAQNRLITVRYLDSQPFRAFIVYLQRHPIRQTSGDAFLVGLLDMIVDRSADILENVGAEIDAVSRDVFGQRDQGRRGRAAQRNRDMVETLKRIGRLGDLDSKTRESLVSIGRMVSFLLLRTKGESAATLRSDIKSLSHDVSSLNDHATFLTTKLNFLLDATLGLINIEQTNVTKIMALTGTVFIPPTLIASIYGMNFKIMPELNWPEGYPLAILLMVLSAILPIWYFRRRGWI